MTSQTLLKAILDHVGDGVIAVDQENRILLWNRRAQEIIGMAAAQIPPQEWPQHYGIFRSPHEDTMPVQTLPLYRALNGETVRSQELFIRNANKPEGHWIAMFARPLDSTRGIPEGAVAVIVDIQKSRQLREQREAQSRELRRIGQLTMIEQVVDSTTHRLSQPFAAIANYAGAAIQLHALERLDDERLEEILGHISRLAERGGEDLQALRHLTQRNTRPHGRVDVNQLVPASLSLLEDHLQRQNIGIEIRLASNIPNVLGQAVELQQVVMHLIINATESLLSRPRESRHLDVITACNSERDYVSIEIGDNGPGIPSGISHKIFEPWFTTKRDALGLGLTVALNIIETHNGTLEAKAVDHKTWFVIALPALHENDD
jgi:PAS domain S-box-containing protein